MSKQGQDNTWGRSSASVLADSRWPLQVWRRRLRQLPHAPVTSQVQGNNTLRTVSTNSINRAGDPLDRVNPTKWICVPSWSSTFVTRIQLVDAVYS